VRDGAVVIGGLARPDEEAAPKPAPFSENVLLSMVSVPPYAAWLPENVLLSIVRSPA
jgi:hypothetical protein